MLNSLATRLVVLVGVSILFIVGVVTYVNNREYGSLVSERIVQSIQQDLKVATTRLELKSEELRSDLRFLASAMPAGDYGSQAATSESSAHYTQLLRSFMASHRHIIQIQFLPFDGKIPEAFYIARQGQQIESVAASVYYQSGPNQLKALVDGLADGAVHTTPIKVLRHVNSAGSEVTIPFVMLSTTVVSSTGDPLGVMSLQANVGSFFQQERSFLAFLDSGLSDTRGNFVTINGDYVLPSKSDDEMDNLMNENGNIASDWPEAAAFLEQGAGLSHLFYSDDGDRVIMIQRFNVGSVANPYYLYAVLNAPLDSLFSELYQLQSWVLLFTLILMVLVFAASALYIHSRLMPLQDLIVKMGGYKPDRPFTPIDVKGHDEISEVTASFNHLALQLRGVFDHEQRIREALNKISLLSTIDENGVIVDCNDNLLEFCNCPREELIGRSVSLFRSGLHDEEFYRQGWEKMRNGQIWRADISFSNDSGNTVWLDTSAVPLMNTESGENRILIIQIDVTERLLLLRELEKERNRAEHASRVKSDFLAGMSHELRTPLNSIIGFSQRLIRKLKGELSPRHMDALETIERNGQHLLQVINEILDVSKIESGRMNVHPEQFELNRVVRDVQLTMSTQAGDRNLSLSDELPGYDILVYLDRKKLVQTLLNLVSNAIKYTNVGRVVIRVTDDNDWVQIAVEDTGIGIKQEDLPKLFTRFTQLESGITQRVEGTGLGLVLANEFVSMQGGKITVNSEFGEGSVFTIRLPKRLDIDSLKEKEKTSVLEQETHP
ncbi:MAG: hypothetical protein AseanaTS_20890 [Candidatus Pelagadaptatus aseana]|uniref:ATP-binding protein n=1 Tax=Candidatus Pelagadaptatus aseana TaxID=3120508 RepID=UPI0039B23B6B